MKSSLYWNYLWQENDRYRYWTPYLHEEGSYEFRSLFLELTRYFFLKLCKVTWAWMLKSDYLKTEFLIAGNHIKVRDPKMWCPKIPFPSLERFWFSRYRGKKFLTKSEYRILWFTATPKQFDTFFVKFACIYSSNL